jgi:hypothetical protein
LFSWPCGPEYCRNYRPKMSKLQGPKGEDEGKGGKYLLLPPDLKGEVPASYIPEDPSATFCRGETRDLPI